MSPTVARLALFQVLTIAYCVFAVGLVLKIHFGHPLPDIFATHLCHYGVFLLVLPLLWCTAAVVEMHRPRVNSGDGLSVVGSGIILLAMLLMLAFLGTMDATHHQSLLLQMHPQMGRYEWRGGE
jgi:hypothetical protein